MDGAPLAASGRAVRVVGVLQAVGRTEIPVDLWYWPHPRTPTGQPQAELHLPGSPPLLERVLLEAYRRGCRAARPGEFTLRGFLHGKLDLVQAEAVLGVVDATDDAELSVALEQLAGGVSQRLQARRQELLITLADLEAGLDFVDEHLEFVSRAEISARVAHAAAEVEQLLADATAREVAAERPLVVLAGLPNAGKSTLFNWLCPGHGALVSDQAGTTRDLLRAECRRSAVRFDVLDTAGWEQVTEGVAGLAQQQLFEATRQADLVVWCTAADLPASQQHRNRSGRASMQVHCRQWLELITRSDLATPDPDVSCLAETSFTAPEPVSENPPWDTSPLPVAHPAMTGGLPALPQSARSDVSHFDTDHPGWMISVTTGEGLSEFVELLSHRLAGQREPHRQWLGSTMVRCRSSLERAAAALDRAGLALHQEGYGDELLAIELREALQALGELVGAVYTDDVLDVLFSRFCIGK
jgi:tRNA modification GTPase